MTLAHAVIIEGGNEKSRMDKALALLKSRFADDPAAAEKLDRGVFEDLIVLEPDEDGKDILVAHIEALLEVFAQKPFASTGKACVIPRGERMNESAQNKLLKLLEEPAAGDVILILAENAERLLPTVRSRCVRIRLGYEEAERGLFAEDVRALTAALVYGKGALAEANHILARYEGSRGEAEAFVYAWQLFLRDIAVGRHSPELIGGSAGSDGSARGDIAAKEWLRDAASKVKQKHAARMREGVLLAEKALAEIGRGGRARYALRGMALSMRTASDERI